MASSFLKKIYENALLLIAGRLFSRAMQFFLFIVAARQLGVATFGVFSFAYATVNLFAIVMDLGLSTFLVQQLSRNSGYLGGLLFRALKLKVILIPLGLGTILLAGYSFSKQDTAMWPLIILGVAAALDSVTSLFNAVFESRQQMKYPALVIAISNGTMSVTGLVLLYFEAQLNTLCWVFAFGALLRCAFTTILFSRTISSLGRMETDLTSSAMLSKAFPFALVTIFVTIYYYIDSLFLTAYCDAEVVGQYNAAYRLFEAPLFIIEAVKTTFFPAASDFYIQDRAELKRLTVQLLEKATAFGISIAVVTALVSVDLITLLYGPAYQSAGTLLSVLIIGVAMIMPGSVCGTTLRAADRQRISAIVTGAGALFNILLNFALIPAYAALGAAWATVATEGFVLMLHSVLLWRLVGPLFSRSFLWRMVLLGVLWVSAIMVTRPLGVVAQILAACLLFFPFLIVCRVFTLDQMNNLMLLRTFRLKLKRDCWSKKRL